MSLLEAGGRWVEGSLSQEVIAEASLPEPLPEDERLQLQSGLAELLVAESDVAGSQLQQHGELLVNFESDEPADLQLIEAEAPDVAALDAEDAAQGSGPTELEHVDSYGPGSNYPKASSPEKDHNEEEHVSMAAQDLWDVEEGLDGPAELVQELDAHACATATQQQRQPSARTSPLPPDFYLDMIGDGFELTWEGVMDLILATIPESVEHLNAEQVMKYARREVQAADRDRDGVLNRDETFRYFYGTLCIKFLACEARKALGSKPEVRSAPREECQDLYKAFVQYCCLGGLSAEMSMGSWIRLCQDCCFLSHEEDGRSMLQLMYVSAKSLGPGGRRGTLLPKPRSSLSFTQFLEALEMVAEKEETGFAFVIEAVLDEIGRDLMPPAAEYAGDIVRQASFSLTPKQVDLAKQKRVASEKHKRHTDGWKPSLNLADDASPKPRLKTSSVRTRPSARRTTLPPLSNVTAKGWIKLCRACNLIVDDDAFSFTEKDAMAILEKVHPHHRVHPRGDWKSKARTAQTPLSHKQLMDCLQAVAGRHRMSVNKICERINNLGNGALAGMDLLPHDKLSSMDMSFEDFASASKARRREASALLKAEKSKSSVTSAAAVQTPEQRDSTGGKSWLTPEQPYNKKKQSLTPNERQKLRTGNAVAFGRCMSAKTGSRKSERGTTARQQRPGTARPASATLEPDPEVGTDEAAVPTEAESPLAAEQGICAIKSSTEIRLSADPDWLPNQVQAEIAKEGTALMAGENSASADVKIGTLITADETADVAEPVAPEGLDPSSQPASSPSETNAGNPFPASGDGQDTPVTGERYQATAEAMPPGVSKEIYEMLQAAREEARQARDRAEALEERLVSLLMQAPHSIPSASS